MQDKIEVNLIKETSVPEVELYYGEIPKRNQLYMNTRGISKIFSAEGTKFLIDTNYLEDGIWRIHTKFPYWTDVDRIIKESGSIQVTRKSKPKVERLETFYNKLPLQIKGIDKVYLTGGLVKRGMSFDDIDLVCPEDRCDELRKQLQHCSKLNLDISPKFRFGYPFYLIYNNGIKVIPEPRYENEKTKVMERFRLSFNKLRLNKLKGG